MRGKILFVVGLGLGYVLGTKAGREQYDRMTSALRTAWNDPRVQERVDDVQEFVKDKAPDLAQFVSERAKSAASRVRRNQPGAESTGADTASPS